MLVDTHTHIYLKQFDHDREVMLKRAAAAGIRAVHLPAVDSETHDALLQTAQLQIPDLEIWPMMGVHPCSINNDFETELSKALALLDNGTQYSAVGEIGLDFYWDKTYTAQQLEAFERQVQWAIDRNLPVVIHSRKATYECIGVMKKFQGRAKGVFHCFSGSVEEAKEILKLGLFLGIGGVVTYKNSGLKEVLQEVGLGQVVLETDAPYLSPVPHRGKRNEPAYVRLVAEAIGDIMEMSFAEVARITGENARRLFPVAAL
ncbi:MAG: TatD family hydrolase [Chitinophagales bacterium]